MKQKIGDYVLNDKANQRHPKAFENLVTEKKNIRIK